MTVLNLSKTVGLLDAFSLTFCSNSHSLLKKWDDFVLLKFGVVVYSEHWFFYGHLAAIY